MRDGVLRLFCVFFFWGVEWVGFFCFSPWHKVKNRGGGWILIRGNLLWISNMGKCWASHGFTTENAGWKRKSKNPRMIKILDTYSGILPIFFALYTLPETNSSPLKMDGLKMNLLLGWPNFRSYVSFREGISIMSLDMEPWWTRDLRDDWRSFGVKTCSWNFTFKFDCWFHCIECVFFKEDMIIMCMFIVYTHVFCYII